MITVVVELRLFRICFFSTCFIFTDQDFHMYLEFKQLPPLTLESNVYWKQILFNVLLHATL